MATAFAAPAPPPAIPSRRLLSGAVMLATVMQVLDSTIANVALPHMQASLGAASDTIVWVLTSYIVASAIATPLTGWLSDRLGVKRLYLAAIVGFVLASMACGAAQSLAQMVAFRAVQGMFGAFLIPLAQATLLRINPRELHGRAMATFGMGVMIGPVLGPILGGWLTENFDWRWVFLINLPIGLAALAGLAVLLPDTEQGRRPFDLFGFALLALAVACFQIALDRGEQLDWFASWEIRIEAGIAIAAAWMFAVHTATARSPLLPRALFSDRNVVTATVFNAAVGVMLLASMALLPPMLQTLFGYPTVTTGIVLAPRGIGTFLSMMIVGRLVDRVDPRLLILTGLALTAASMHMMTGFSLDMDMRPVVVSGVLQGMGIGLIFVPLNTIAFGTIAAQYRTDAAGLLTLVRTIGSSVGISVVTLLLGRMMATSHADLAAQVTPYRLPGAEPGLLAGLGGIGQTAAALVEAEVSRQAAMIAYIDDFHFMFVMSLAIMPLVLLLKPARRAPAALPGDLH